MANTRKIPADLDLEERAKFFGVCERTARRWHNSGADLTDLESVTNLILRQRHPKASTIQLITKHRNEESVQLSTN